MLMRSQTLTCQFRCEETKMKTSTTISLHRMFRLNEIPAMVGVVLLLDRKGQLSYLTILDNCWSIITVDL